MKQNEKFKDRLFRYRYLYRVRQTEKSKNKFLGALVTDISEIRDDIHVMEYKGQKKYASRNVYVGNIEKANRIICTYYDAPLHHFGPYTFFDRKLQAKRTSGFILVSSIAAILIGLVVTLLYMQAGRTFTLVSWQSFLIALIYGGYFYFMGKITMGMTMRNTLVRNTSSVLTLLTLMEEIKDGKTAFAFLDDGAFGDNGLESLQTAHNSNATIYYLDSIGSDAPLQAIGKDFSADKLNKLVIAQHEVNQKINYLVSARTSGDGAQQSFYLTKADLNQKELNTENMKKVLELFK